MSVPRLLLVHPFAVGFVHSRLHRVGICIQLPVQPPRVSRVCLHDVLSVFVMLSSSRRLWYVHWLLVNDMPR